MKISAFVMLFLCGALSTCVRAAPVGMAAQVKGTVFVVQSGQKTPLRVLGRLEEGDAVLSGPNSMATIVLFSGGVRYQIGANARANVLASGVQGAKKLADLSGPSASAVKLLGSARVAALMSREMNSFQRLDGNPSGIISPLGSHFAWLPIAEATRYTFTLFDTNDNVVWSVSSGQSSVTYPVGAPPLMEKQPYLWKVSGFSTAGKRLLDGRWGLVTALTDEDSRALDRLATELQAQATPTDKTPLLLLVEIYRSYGVINRALELLESPELSAEAGISDAKNDLLDNLSPFARVLAGRAVSAVQ